MERAGEYCSTPLVCCRRPPAPHIGGDDRSRHYHPDLLVDVFEKEPQRVDSSLRQENGCYFEMELGFMCCCSLSFFFFNLTKTDTGDHYQRDCDVLLL